MEARTLKTLEYQKIIEKLCEHTESKLGKEHAKNLKPMIDIYEINNALLETDEALMLSLKRGNPPLFGIKPIKSEAKRSQLGGMLSPFGLLKIAESLRCVNALKKYISEAKKDDKDANYPSIETKITALSYFSHIEKAISQAIISAEEIADDASPRLKRLRIEKNRKLESVKHKLNSIVNSDDNKKFLQDSIVTIREGRYVVPVRQENKSKVPGIVHDISGSGATVFIEPQIIVELNNEIRELEIKEREEIEKILTELTEKVAEYAEEIAANEQLLIDLDFIFAKAKYALKEDAIMPQMNTDGILNLKQARHPLLDKKTVVPIDVEIGEKFTSLVITGPNTGGKTVSLKTTGLLTLMAQSGLFIPAKSGSKLTVFNSIYADIGDEQSIEQSLSTFSSHMVNIVDILKKADYNSLVLLDELGAGTDPTEGAVLAMAILDELKNRGSYAMATTHYNQLKMYAINTEGVQNASMEFDIESLSPTFKLLIGLPGKSNAFEISKRLGLPTEIIDTAKELIDSENVEFEDMLAQIDKNRLESERILEEIERLKKEQKASEEELKLAQEKLKAKEERILKRAREEAKEILDKTKEDVELILSEIKNVAEMEKDSARTIQQAQDYLRDRQSEIGANLKEDLLKKVDKKKPKDLQIGDTVEIVSLGQKGTLLTLPDSSGNVSVQAGLLKLNVPANTIRISKEAEVKVKERSKKMGEMKAKYIKTEIDIRGKNVEEAINILDKYIDDAYLAGLKQIRIIHGKGTGALSAGLKPYFKKHHHISKTRYADMNEGGTGVTVLSLK
ncbi:MAG: endonuclease MutS2 [Tissierellia bacterium]|nr:endonuclease MutS2 [Tissierellia bacterium]